MYALNLPGSLEVLGNVHPTKNSREQYFPRHMWMVKTCQNHFTNTSQIYIVLDFVCLVSIFVKMMIEASNLLFDFF